MKEQQQNFSFEGTIDVTQSDVFRKYITNYARYMISQHKKAIRLGKVRNASPIDKINADPDFLINEYRAILTKSSKQPSAIRKVIQFLGNKAADSTVNEIISQVQSNNP